MESGKERVGLCVCVCLLVVRERENVREKERKRRGGKCRQERNSNGCSGNLRSIILLIYNRA